MYNSTDSSRRYQLFYQLQALVVVAAVVVTAAVLGVEVVGAAVVGAAIVGATVVAAAVAGVAKVVLCVTPCAVVVIGAVLQPHTTRMASTITRPLVPAFVTNTVTAPLNINVASV